MLKMLNKKKKENKGFTLVELVVVVAILAILVGLLAPQYTKYVEKSRKASDAANMDEMVRAVQIYAADEGSNVTDISSATIVMSTEETTITDSTLLAAMDAAGLSDYEKTTLKSKNWGENPTAAITIKDGNVSVSYGTGKFATYMSSGSSTTTSSTTTGGTTTGGTTTGGTTTQG